MEGAAANRLLPIDFELNKMNSCALPVLRLPH